MYAIVSDLHSNLEAMTAVLEDIESRGIEEIVCLGDMIGYGPDPRAVLDIAKSKFRFCLLGNHEHAILFTAVGFNVKAMAAVEWTREQLNSKDYTRDENHQVWNFLGSIQSSRTEGDILYVHASPMEPITQYILPVDIHSKDLMTDLFAKVPRIGFGGHTHIPGVFTSGGKFISPRECDGVFTLGAERVFCNVGSTGQPRDGDNRACYATFDGARIEWHRVRYDFLRTQKKIFKTKRLPEVLGHRLAVGR
ncbi:MAG: metallophosphoesterase [Planctomycetes bacterium]|nr:metallophosphoesterase [Planctomycetota bacterium]